MSDFVYLPETGTFLNLATVIAVKPETLRSGKPALRVYTTGATSEAVAGAEGVAPEPYSLLYTGDDATDLRRRLIGRLSQAQREAHFPYQPGGAA
jgi:hypothetical protein